MKMKAEDKLQIEKFLFMLINSFFVILGISLFGASLWVLFDKSNMITVVSNETNVKVVARGLFIIGLVVVGVSTLGCIGVQLENRCFIALYMGLLITIIFGELFITFLLLMNRSQIERFLTNTVDSIISMYGVNASQTTWSLLDSVQQSAKCCGRQNTSDWATNKFIQLQDMADIYPCSCFNGTCPVFLTSGRYQFGNGTHIYTTGCEEKLKDWFVQNVFVIIGMDLALLFIQILQFILGLFICRNIGHKINSCRPENLLNAMEEAPAPSSDPQLNDLEQSNIHTSDKQQHYAYSNQDNTEHSYYQDQDPQHNPNNPAWSNDQRRHEYENPGQRVYQHHHGPDHNPHPYNQEHEAGYAQQHSDAMTYDQDQGQHYDYDRDLHNRQNYNSYEYY